jgi:hypothetical protein
MRDNNRLIGEIANAAEVVGLRILICSDEIPMIVSKD